LLTTRTI
jgi:L-iditol 2-dehydrogenase